MLDRKGTIGDAKYEFNELMCDNNSYRASIGNAGDGLAQPRTRHKPFFLRAFFDVERPLR